MRSSEGGLGDFMGMMVVMIAGRTAVRAECIANKRAKSPENNQSELLWELWSWETGDGSWVETVNQSFLLSSSFPRHSKIN